MEKESRRGECEHPYYRSITNGQKQCVKCGHRVIFKPKPAPQEAADGTT